jgi:hypothetical protein
MRIRFALALVTFAMLAVPFMYWAILTVSALKRGQVSKCPNCYSSRIRVSLKRFNDLFFPRFMPCRCESCKKRFYCVVSMNFQNRAISR